MKNVAGTWCRSRSSRILGTDVVAPYSPTVKGTGRGFARCSNSLSTSKERQTATRAPFGQALGVSFLPTLAVPTACRICSSVESTVIGVTAAGAGGWRDDCAGWALGELQPGSNPINATNAAYGRRLREGSMRSPSPSATVRDRSSRRRCTSASGGRAAPRNAPLRQRRRRRWARRIGTARRRAVRA